MMIDAIILLLVILAIVVFILYRNRKMLVMLRDSEERIHLILDAAPLGINLWNRNIQNLFTNDEAVRMFGLSGKQEYLDKFFELSPEYQPNGQLTSEFGEACIKKVYTEGWCRQEWMHQKPNGEPLPCELTLVRVKYKDDYVAVGFMRDLREEKKMLRNIRETEDRLQVMLDTSPLAINFLDWNYNIVECNKAALNMFGMSDKRKYFENFHELTPFYQPNGDVSKETFKAHLDKAAKYGYHRFEWEHLRADGTTFQCEITVVRSTHKEQGFLVAHLRDLSDMKNAVRKIHEAEEQKHAIEEAHQQLQTIIDILPVGVIIMSRKDGELLYANKTIMDIFNCKSFEEDVAGRKSFDFMPEFQPDGRKTVDLVKDVRSQDKDVREIQCVKFTGEIFLARVAYCVINYNGVIASLNIVEDMTAEKEYQKMLRDIALKEQEANQLKSRFLATMSHEIRTPMNAIIGMSEIAMRKDSLPDVRQDVEMIKSAGTNLLAIINDILDFSRIESGKMEIVSEEYSVPSLIEDVVSIIKVRLTDGLVQFDTNIDETLPEMLIGDVVRIRQVLLNILNNAVKFTEEGSILFTLSGNKINDETVVLTMTVADTGKGIKEEDIGKLFNEFVQVDAAFNRGIEGTGLGLAITRRLVVAMGGDIGVKSVYGKGSEFTITLPQKICLQKNDASVAQDGSAGTTVTFSAPNAHVLIVDDVHVNLKVIEGLLLPYNMRIDVCRSGLEAIEAATFTKYDLIFMDHMMPGMDGVEVVRHIRELGANANDCRHLKDVPIIALTANAVSGVEEMFLQNGFNDFLPKPIDTVKLNSVLMRWIRKEKQHAATVRNFNVEGDVSGSNNIDMVIDGVDVKIGISRTGGTIDRFMQTLAIFLRDGAGIIDVIRKALDTNDMPLYITRVHGLKSAASNIGAIALSELAKELEDAGRGREKEFVDENTPKLLTDMERLLCAIENALATAKEKTSAQILDMDALKPILADLKAAINTIDIAAISAAVKRLEPFEAAPVVGNAVTDILHSVLNGDYEKAAELTDALR